MIVNISIEFSLGSPSKKYFVAEVDGHEKEIVKIVFDVLQAMPVKQSSIFDQQLKEHEEILTNLRNLLEPFELDVYRRSPNRSTISLVIHNGSQFGIKDHLMDRNLLVRISE